MLIPKSRWVVRKADQQLTDELSEELNIAPFVVSLLVNRGITTKETAIAFLNAEKETLYDPFLFPDMKKTVERIKLAIDQQQPILIFGDYDADGVTSTTVLLETLSKMGANVTYYIPNRFTEGYGPNKQAFQKAYEDGIKLIITVDTGIAALAEANQAKELGMDLIITDHHEAGEKLPEAYSIIHPSIAGSTYPFKHLAGVGVAFKLAHALNGEVPEDLLDLVAIGTIADLVPLFGENRSLVKKGLQRLSTTARIGLQEICELAGNTIAEIDEEKVGFLIGPRLNAPGRLGHAGPAVRLLKTRDSIEAKMLAEEIDEINSERKLIVSTITEEAIQMVDSQLDLPENKVIIVGKTGWNPGVVGIVASRLVEKYYRPTIVLSYDEQTGMAKGSARSIQGFNLYEHLSSTSDILPHFGGHAMAAGMSLKMEDVDLLHQRLNEIANKQLREEDFIPVTDIDAVVRLEDITIHSIAQLDQLAPYGMGNPKPKILIEDALLTASKRIGANKNHMRITVNQEDHLLDGIGFQLGHLTPDLSIGSKTSIIGELSINEWNNQRKPQIFVKDVAIKEWQLFDLRGNRHYDRWIPYLKEKEGLFVFFDDKNFTKYGTNLDSVHITNQGMAEQLNINERNVILFDLSPQMDWIESLLKGKKPGSIHAHFLQEENHFLATVPTRDHFKWYYAFLLKKGIFDLQKYGEGLAKHRGWSKETITFMSKVFFDLDFVTMKDGIIKINPQKGKRDLEDSPTYKKKQEQIRMDKEFTYSTYNELKNWFDERLAHNVQAEEETSTWI